MQILVITDFQKAIERAKEILYEKVTRQTVLFLSGGATPKSLYTSMSKDRIIRPAAVGMIDERYGKKLHEKSNERMIQETGLLEYLTKQNISFYPILKSNLSRENAATSYDRTTRDLFFHFHKSVAVMGIGSDGHIAGIVPIKLKSKTEKVKIDKGEDFVISYTNKKMVPPERITMTFAGLSLIDYFIVLVFGKEKKNALQQMFSPGSIEEVPARFFMRTASDNTVVITDQQV